jgi:hypothetical protein
MCLHTVNNHQTGVLCSTKNSTFSMQQISFCYFTGIAELENTIIYYFCVTLGTELDHSRQIE